MQQLAAKHTTVGTDISSNEAERRAQQQGRQKGLLVLALKRAGEWTTLKQITPTFLHTPSLIPTRTKHGSLYRAPTLHVLVVHDSAHAMRCRAT